MPNDPAEYTVLANLIKSRDAALEKSTGLTVVDDSGKRVKKTASGMLLHRAVSVLGAEIVAESLAITTEALDHLLASSKPMTLAQQRTLGLAIFVVSGDNREIRSRAIALLAQVDAAADFQAGVTKRHMNSPAEGAGWK
jgi:hypothetical protein